MKDERRKFQLTMMLAFYLTTVLMVHGVAFAIAAGTSPNAENELTFIVSELNPEETSRIVLQCEAITEGSQVVGITKGNQLVSWDGQLKLGFVRGGTSPRFVMARVEVRQGKTIDLLTINTVCTTDEGTYKCNIYDKTVSGNSTSYVVLKSRSVDISVRKYDRRDQCQTSGEITALRGDNLSLICSWRSGGASLSWTDGRNGSPVDSAMTVVQSVSSAKINLAVTDDLEGAMFQCSASVNVCNSGVNNCSVGPIIVIPEPHITVTSAKTHIEAGEMAEFVCTLIPSVTSSPPIVSWYTVPPLEANRAYFSSTGLARMLIQMYEDDDGMVVYCTTTFGEHSATGEYRVVVSSNVTGTNGVVDSTGDAVQTTPSSLPTENSTSASPHPFILFGSYPITVAIISGGSVFVPLLLALIVFCCCRGRRRRKAKPLPANNRQLRLSPSTFGTDTPGLNVPGGGTDGLYMYATIFDPDEQWGATPGSTPSRATTVRANDVGGYQQPKAGASTPPVYSQVGGQAFDSTPIYMETNLTSPNSANYFELSPPEGMVGNALYQSSGEYVNPVSTDQETVDKELSAIKAEKRLAATSRQAQPSPSSSGYLAIGEIPDEVRAGSLRDMYAKSAVYMEIS